MISMSDELIVESLVRESGAFNVNFFCFVLCVCEEKEGKTGEVS